MQNTEQNAVLLRLAREYGDSVVRMCCVYLKDYHLAQDVAQETFLQAARKYGALARTDSEKAWLMRIAVNRCKNELRTQWFRRAQELPEPSGADPYPVRPRTPNFPLWSCAPARNITKRRFINS